MAFLAHHENFAIKIHQWNKLHKDFWFPLVVSAIPVSSDFGRAVTLKVDLLIS